MNNGLACWSPGPLGPLFSNYFIFLLYERYFEKRGPEGPGDHHTHHTDYCK